MSRNQLPVNGVLLNIGIVERSQIEQRITELVCSETCKFQEGAFLGSHQLLYQRSLLGRCLGEQRLGLGFLESASLYQRTGETAKR